MAKQFSKINFQVQTQLGLLDISAQIQFSRFFFIFFFSKLIVLIKLKPFLMDFCSFSSVLSGHINSRQQFRPKYELIDRLLAIHA